MKEESNFMKSRSKAALCVLLMVIVLLGCVLNPEYQSRSSIMEDPGQFQSKATIVPVVNEMQANTYTTSAQDEPSVSALTADTFVVAWNSVGQDGDGWGVYAAVFSATTGENLTPKFQANTYTTGGQYRAFVSALTADTFVVAWRSDAQDGSGSGVYATVFSATTGGNLTAEFRVNNHTPGSQDYPSITPLTADTFAVAWHSDGQDGDGYGVFATVFNATTGENLTAEFQVNTYTTNFQTRPSISALTADTFAVAWTSYGQDGDGWGVYAAVFNATTGENLTAEFRVNTYTASEQQYPSVSSLTADSFVVAWESMGQDGDGDGVYAAVFSATTGGILTPEFLVNTYTIDDQNEPSVSALTADTFAVAWHSDGQDGDSLGVYAAVFSATSGKILTPEFQVNTYTANWQYMVSISALTADTFAVAWTSYGQDGDGNGIFFRVLGSLLENPGLLLLLILLFPLIGLGIVVFIYYKRREEYLRQK